MILFHPPDAAPVTYSTLLKQMTEKLTLTYQWNTPGPADALVLPVTKENVDEAGSLGP